MHTCIRLTDVAGAKQTRVRHRIPHLRLLNSLLCFVLCTLYFVLCNYCYCSCLLLLPTAYSRLPTAVCLLLSASCFPSFQPCRIVLRQKLRRRIHVPAIAC